MGSDQSPAVVAAHSYFRTTEERFEKGSGLGIAQEMEAANAAKTSRLRAARLEAEAASAVADSENASNAPPNRTVRKRKPKD
ncbi:MAG: hypothetical protein EON58_11020 [Alphaproteobacteria bacterium]|nr:MAG: hypothetical protein EON58_11020 [Alphaproteobacteria bacterium]